MIYITFKNLLAKKLWEHRQNHVLLNNWMFHRNIQLYASQE